MNVSKVSWIYFWSFGNLSTLLTWWLSSQSLCLQVPHFVSMPPSRRNQNALWQPICHSPHSKIDDACPDWLTDTRSKTPLPNMHCTPINLSPRGWADKQANVSINSCFFEKFEEVCKKQAEGSNSWTLVQPCCPFDPLTRLLTSTRHNVFSHECSVNHRRLPLTLKRKYFYGLQAPVNKFKAV